MHSALAIVAVAVGGAAGASLRFAIAEGVRGLTSWPWYVSTMIANIAGCLAIGYVYVGIESGEHPAWVKPLLVTGLLGAFTTFSTFSLDAMHLIEERRYGELATYLVVSVLVGLVAVKGGMVLGR
ncbi:MAG: CrcB family protein [Phycisphaerales bacterium]|nr:CrcB family protein [Phycisphaerae bacterium]NNF44069.1 CrcB family protein [Phycisphaerales bacterium]NNM25286.1 CrcB family protein [Phycisphaerales bacterium]